MKLGVPWHIKGVHPNARVSAREAARRAGMSVGEWLNSVILESSEDAEHGPDDEYAYEPPPRSHYDRQRDEMRYQPRRETRYEPRYEPAYAPRGYSRREEEARYEQDPIADEVAAIHDRLEGLTAGIEHLTRSTSAARSSYAAEQDDTARRLADAVAKLDQRVEHMVNEGRNATRAIERRVENVDRALSSLTQPIASQPVFGQPAFNVPPFVQSPPVAAGWASPMDQAMAEINLRQRELEGDSSAAHARAMPSRHGFAPRNFAPQPAPQPQYAPPAFDRQQFANVEDKLRHITEQMDTLGPDRMHDALASLRNDLADIARTLSEASPRRAIEALETEVRLLTTKLDTRGRSGVSASALATMEKGLSEVRDALRGLTPAENLAGAVAAIHALSGKIDQMASGYGQDPASLQQLETAIAGLRSIVSHAASNESLSALTTEVRALAQRIDAGPAATRGDDVLKSLESRISTIADAIESVRAAGGRGAPDIDGMVRTLGDKIESLRAAPTDSAALSQLDQRITHLVQKLDASESRLGNLDAIERGMKELLGYLAEVRSNTTPSRPPQPNVAQDVRRTEKSLEQVHDTIGDVVDRLAMIETGMRAPGAAPNAASTPAAPPPPPRPQPQAAPQYAAPPQRAAPPPPAQMPPAAPFNPAPPPQQPMRQSPLPSYAQPGAAAASSPAQTQAQAPQFQQAAPPPRHAAAAELRPAADGTLPYDFPLEPGSGKPRPGMAQPLPGVSSAVAAFRSSPAERIAASKAALAPPPPPPAAAMPAAAPPAPDSGDGEPKSNFILAARRAAQFAAETQTTAATADFKHAPDIEAAPVSLVGRLRKHAKSILVGASVLILLAAGIHMAVNFLGFGESAPEAPKPQSQLSAPEKLSQLAPAANSNVTGSVGQLPQPPDPFGIAGNRPESPPQIAAPRTIQVPDRVASVAAPAAAQPAPEATGSIPHKLVPPPSGLFTAAASMRPIALPPGIGGRNLIAAADGGDATAAYEVAVRYSDGRGVSQNLHEAAAWFERAARGGVTPAIFRLGGLYEKGIGVKKDLARARKLYIAAAERGSAKAMHNLAVLYAEGGDAKPDYPNAIQWFTKAAARGVADSQFNLGVLYARGIGVEQNMAESYKWFSLAAQSGDRDAAQKRDEIGKRLDGQSLAAVRTALQSWQQEGQPDEAVSVSIPAAGWDQAAAAAPQPAPAPDKSKAKRAQNSAPAPRAKTL